MENIKSSIFFTLAFMLMGTCVQGCGNSLHHHNGAPIRKLFVFGDSYADTGNLGKIGWAGARSWLYPYGTTFPHRPTGRFSDGRLLTDFVASFMGNKSPLPYKYRKTGQKLLPYGMNFAVGGTGIFDLGNHERNLSAQIDTFEGQLSEGVFSDCDLKSSVALVVVSGNDYAHFAESGGTMDEIFDFMDKLIGRIKSELKRVADIGVRKVVVSKLIPLGCTPYITRGYNYTMCDGLYDQGAQSHNTMLEDAVTELGKASNQTEFLLLDLETIVGYLVNPENYPWGADLMKGSKKFKNILKPCCDGKTSDAICGQVDKQGVKQYTLCCNPDDYFFWDDVHPTQAGWTEVFEHLKDPLRKFLG